MRRSERLDAGISVLAAAAAVGMFVVLVMGAAVTSTGSATGCGRSWPLCGGRFIPDFALATAIEFSHRAVTGVEGVLVVALTAAVLWRHGDQGPIRVLAPLMLGFLFLQAGMGAWAVMAPQQPVVLALHFGISLIALATTVLTALYLRGRGAMRTVPVAGGAVRAATWGMAGYLYLLIYSGAYVRHAGAAAACSSWPLCASGAPLGPEAVAVAVNLLHRTAAAVAVVLAVGLLVAYRRLAPTRPDLATGAWVLIATLLAQGGAGAVLVLSRWSVSGELLHDAVSGIAFTAAAYLCLRVTLGTRPEPAVEAPPARRQAGATSSG